MYLWNLLLPSVSLSSGSSSTILSFDHPDFILTGFVFMLSNIVLSFFHGLSLFPLLVHSFFFLECILVHWQASGLVKQTSCQNSQSSCTTVWFVPEPSKSFSVKISQLSWALFPFMASSQGTPPNNFLKISLKVCSPEIQSAKACCFPSQASFRSRDHSSCSYCNPSCQLWLHFPHALHCEQ